MLDWAFSSYCHKVVLASIRRCVVFCARFNNVSTVASKADGVNGFSKIATQFVESDLKCLRSSSFHKSNGVPVTNTTGSRLSRRVLRPPRSQTYRSARQGRLQADGSAASDGPLRRLLGPYLLLRRCNLATTIGGRNVVDLPGRLRGSECSSCASLMTLLSKMTSRTNWGEVRLVV